MTELNRIFEGKQRAAKLATFACIVPSRIEIETNPLADYGYKTLENDNFPLQARYQYIFVPLFSNSKILTKQQTNDGKNM